MEKIYDAIIIGARCAGSPTAMLLARKGYRVLLVDKAEFPSDTISTHIIFAKGLTLLMKWGLLESVEATNCTAIRKLVIDFGPFTLEGKPELPPGIQAILAPRRYQLDPILVHAAIASGVEFRENCRVEEILMSDDQVTGIRCRTKGGSAVTEKARIVIGADGRNSILAKAVQADKYDIRPTFTCWYYTYWSGIDEEDLVQYLRPYRAFALIPTNDNLVCLPVAWPANELHEYRSDIEGNYLKTIALNPELAEKLHHAKREDGFTGMSDLPNFFRKPYGPGWALVGDAGYHKDPITGQGISDAFFCAEILAEALDSGFSGRENPEHALARYQQLRDEEVRPMFELTCDWATLGPPPPHMEQLFASLYGNQKQTDRFLSVLAGTESVPSFFSPENIQAITGGMKV